MKSVRSSAVFLLKAINYFAKDLFKMIPRKKNKWVFGEIDNFRDNPKYLFYSIQDSNPEIDSIWIAKKNEDVILLRKQGYKAYYWLSLMAFYHCATAKVWISGHSISNINPFLSEGAFFVNLWHGVSLKRVKWQAPDYHIRKYGLKNKEEMRSSLSFRIKTYTSMFRKPDLCLTPSEAEKNLFFAGMFDIPKEKCIVGVYPRSKFLIEGKQSAMEFIKKKEPKETLDFVTRISTYNNKYIYMPTYRNDGVDFIKKAGIDWEALNEVLKKKNDLFILKFHPNTHIDVSGIENFEHICIYPPLADIYTILPFTDVLITDYSSVYSDFLMMNKEVILFVFDYDEYVKGSFELKDYDQYYLGKRAYSFTQLLDIISDGEDCHVPQDQYSRLMDFFWSNNENTINIVEEIKRRIHY